MKRKVWILVQQLLPKRNSKSWEPNRHALAYKPWNMSVRLRGRCRLTDKLSVSSEPIHARRIGSYYINAETSSVFSVFIARGYLRSNAQNRHPFHHLPCSIVHKLASAEIPRRNHSVIACSCHVYMGVVLRAHPVRGSHIQRNANEEVATPVIYWLVCAYTVSCA